MLFEHGLSLQPVLEYFKIRKDVFFMKKTIITFVLLAMVALVPAVSFAAENLSDEKVKYLENVSWGESYHDFSLKYSVKPLLETCEIMLDEKVSMYGREMKPEAVACFNNDRLFMVGYYFSNELTDEEYDKVSEAVTKEYGEKVAKNIFEVIGEAEGWANGDKLIMLTKDAIWCLNTSIIDSDKLISLKQMEVLAVRR